VGAGGGWLAAKMWAAGGGWQDAKMWAAGGCWLLKCGG